MSECATFNNVVCKCGSPAADHTWVETAQMLGGCTACEGCVVFVPSVTPEIDAERLARWQAEPRYDGLSVFAETRGARLADVPTVERGTVGEEGRHSREGAQPGGPDLCSPTYWRPSPVRRTGTPVAF
jgi:hypothetical protein